MFRLQPLKYINHGESLVLYHSCCSLNFDYAIENHIQCNNLKKKKKKQTTSPYTNPTHSPPPNLPWLSMYCTINQWYPHICCFFMLALILPVPKLEGHQNNQVLFKHMSCFMHCTSFPGTFTYSQYDTLIERRGLQKCIHTYSYHFFSFLRIHQPFENPQVGMMPNLWNLCFVVHLSIYHWINMRVAKLTISHGFWQEMIELELFL